MALKFYPLNVLNYEHVHSADVRISAFSQEVERAWQLARQQNSCLFEGTVFNCVDIQQGFLRIQRMDYGIFYVKNFHPELLQNYDVSVLAVSSITFVGNKVLIGKRSQNVTQFRGKWETVASGTLEVDEELHGSLNQVAISQLRSEFREETSLDSALLKNIYLRGLLVDSQAYTADLIYRSEIEPRDFLGRQEIKVLSTAEYSSFKLINLRYLRLIPWVALNLVPTSKFILKFLKL